MEASRERGLLRGVDIFAELDERALDDMLQAAHRRRIAKGETAFGQDEEARSFCVLLEGLK
jgi:hypothetical protein